MALCEAAAEMTKDGQLVGQGPQPWDTVPGTLQSPMVHPKSWGEVGRSQGGPALRHLPLYLALTR